MIKLLVANWKLYVSRPQQALKLISSTARASKNVQADIVLCPPAPWLSFVHNALGSKHKNISLGAQDIFWENQGAFTGAFGPQIIKAYGVKYVIVGHSERRRIFKETDEVVAKKLQAALRAGLHAILCVGETARKDFWKRDLLKQLRNSIKGLTRQQLNKLIIAYEPVWAIGTGKADTPQDALESIIEIRRAIFKKFGKAASLKVKILYGGSVNAKNTYSFLTKSGIDGALIGKASTNAKEFSRIVSTVGKI
ncbi:MAG: triose-phosphate isomerase [Candidatus Terrybacteria bacterium RIFCSPLOWO2_01_FULL_44_24]|nr:MAG: triose-phosphate isomerase [Candidatus Terrybacteria bacterium RIFCSPHIGHO2_02_FULL_43_14]OHA51636.1 MAG: triose-phosphate isomerase [Candidatus Terrybacteria bacterium RIFCSPLOWO2_01_FULL_44_24]